MTLRPADRLRLRLLATTDLHGHILPWNELCNIPAPDRGLAQIASLITTARAEEPNCLLLDNGDFLNSSPLSDFIAETWHEDPTRLHPMIEAMNRLGYDVATLGNHEFSHGLDHLHRALAQARFKVVTTNLSRISAESRRRKAFLPRHLLLQRTLAGTDGTAHALTIGILGFLPPQTTQWERQHLTGRIAADGILSSARAAVPKLRRAGANVVIALSHSGLGGAADNDEAENISCALAGIEGIDAVIAGHTHQSYPPVASTFGAEADDTRPLKRPDAPLIMPGFFGSHLGVIDLTLERRGEGWFAIGHKAELRPVCRRVGPLGQIEPLAEPDPALTALAERDTVAMRRLAAEPVGETAVALQSHFALIGHCPVQNLLAEAQSQNMRSLLAGLPEAALPLLVAVAPFKAGGRGGPANYIDIPPGRLTARHISDLYIHPNTPVALLLSGAEVSAWLERSVSLFRQVDPGSESAPLIDTDFPAFNFDMIHGLTFRIDLSQPARFGSLGQVLNPEATRITDLRYQGRDVQRAESFVLATNSYRASAGAGFSGTDPSRVILEENRPLRRILRDHLAASGRLSLPDRQGWSFAPLPGTTVIFDTGPGASCHASAISGLEAIGLQPTGFMRFRLRL